MIPAVFERFEFEVSAFAGRRASRELGLPGFCTSGALWFGAGGPECQTMMIDCDSACPKTDS